MPVALSQRSKLVVRGLADGLTQAQAYENAGYKPDHSNASRLTRKDPIRKATAELIEKRADKARGLTALGKRLLETGAEELATADPERRMIAGNMLLLAGLKYDSAHPEQEDVSPLYVAALRKMVDKAVRVGRYLERRKLRSNPIELGGESVSPIDVT